jgi:hypothetical protein
VRIAALAAAAFLPLGGCAAVFVQTAGHPVEVHFGLGVPRIDRGENDALVLRKLSVGLYLGCWSAGVGVQACEEFRFDPRSCGVGVVVIDPHHPANRQAIARLAERVRAECARTPKEPTDDHQASVPTGGPGR